MTVVEEQQLKAEEDRSGRKCALCTILFTLRVAEKGTDTCFKFVARCIYLRRH